MPWKPLYNYFGVGARLEYLRQVKSELPIHGSDNVLEMLKSFLDDTNEFPLPTTRIASQDLLQFYKDLKKNQKDIHYQKKMQ